MKLAIILIIHSPAAVAPALVPGRGLKLGSKISTGADARVAPALVPGRGLKQGFPAGVSER